MPKKVRVVGSVHYSDLSPEFRWDFALGVTEALERKYGQSLPRGNSFGTGRIVHALLSDNPVVEVVALDPKRLKACKRMSGAVHTAMIERYRKAYLRGDEFPPIVVNSSLKDMLVEGLHRACAADRADVVEISALDVASIDLEAVLRHGDKLLFPR